MLGPRALAVELLDGLLYTGIAVAVQRREHALLLAALTTLVERLVLAWWKPRSLGWEDRRRVVRILACCAQLKDQLDALRRDMFVNALVALLKDPDFRVRHEASRNVAVLFAVYREAKVQQGIYATLCDAVKPALASASDARRSALQTLATVAKSSHVNELNVLVDCCVAWTAECSHVVVLVLEDVAAHLGFASLGAYVREWLPDLFNVWFARSLGVERFPWLLTGVSSFADFVAQFAPLMVAKSVFHLATNELELVAQRTGATVHALLVSNLPAIFAHAQPLFYVGTDSNGKFAAKAEEIFALLLAHGVSQDVVSHTITTRFDDCIFALFDVVSPTSSSVADAAPEPPEFSQQAVRAVFVYLGRGFRAATVADILFKTRDRVHKIVLFLHERFAASHRIHRKRATMDKLGLLMEMLWDASADASKKAAVISSVLRDLVHFLLRGLSSSALIPTSCALLRRLCAVALGTSHEPELHRHFGRIVAALVPLVDVGSEDAKSLLEFLVVECRDTFATDIAQLDPIPDSSSAAFAAVTHVYGSLTRARTLRMELERLAARDLPSGEAGRLALEYLRARLSAERAQLPTLRNQHAALFAQVTWTLIRVCATSSLPSAKLLAASCLGDVGLMSLPGSVGGALTPLLRLGRAASGDPRAANSDKKAAHARTVVAIVRELASYLVDDDVPVIRAASVCMRELLATPLGGEAFRQLTADEADALYPFRPTQQEQALQLQQLQQQQQLPQMRSARAILPPAGLWCTHRKNFDQWLCPLAAALCALVDDPDVQFLRLCAPVFALKAPLAEHLLPLIIDSLAADPATGLGAQLAAAAEQEVLRDPHAPIRAVQLVLSAMRSHLDAWVAAEAARRCSLYVSALLFLELSVEREFGALAIPDAPSARRAAYLQMLLDVYSHIDEPDSLRGVPVPDSDGDLSAAILLHEHDERWELALSCYDRALSDGARVAHYFVGIFIHALQLAANQRVPCNCVRVCSARWATSGTCTCGPLTWQAWRRPALKTMPAFPSSSWS